PITCVAFDPTADTLYAGTLAGVWALDYAGITAATAPTWGTFSVDLPLLLVNDLAFVAGSRRLLCATFGRGIFRCDVGAAAPPASRLFVRQHAIEDGRTYPRSPALDVLLDGDPRVEKNTVPLTFGADGRVFACDMRVDASPLVSSHGRIDGGEFDMELA